MTKENIGIFGAKSLVGRSLLPTLIKNNFQVTAFSRNAELPTSDSNNLHWKTIDQNAQFDEQIPLWICMAPIWSLSNYFDILEKSGVKRIVALSSTSRFGKLSSSDPEDQKTVFQLIEGEKQLEEWANSGNIEWIILRPTIIYGTGNDKNISEIIRFIRMFNFFPVFGKADGLRQPIHAEDVADACYSALLTKNVKNKSYNISGAEILTYRHMIQRIFTSINRRPLLLTVPIWFFKLAISVLRLIPRYKKWSTSMAERMNNDLAFDHAEAIADFGFSPRTFQLAQNDII